MKGKMFFLFIIFLRISEFIFDEFCKWKLNSFIFLRIKNGLGGLTLAIFEVERPKIPKTEQKNGEEKI